MSTVNLVRPVTITDAMITSCDVAETDYTEFSMGTTYAVGDRCIDSTGVEVLTLDVAPATEWAAGDLITGQTGSQTARVVAKLTALTYSIRERSGAFTLGEVIGVTGDADKLADQGAAHPTVTAAASKVHKVYEAIANVAIEVMTLDVAPATAWIDGRIITGQTSGKTCVVVTRLTDLTYIVKDRDGAFTLNEIVGVTGIAAELADQGAANPTFATATNAARYPATDLLRTVPAFWKEVSATNRWKAFDRKNGSQVSQATSMTFVLAPGMIDSIGLQNMDATSVALTMTVTLTDWDDVEDFDLVTDIDGSLVATVFSETIDLISTLGIIDAWTYCFEPIVRRTSIVRTNLPPYSTGVLTITITNTGGTAKVGEIVVGQKRDIGTLLYGPEIGLVDYSQKSADESGVYSFVEGAYSKTNSLSLKIPNTSVDEVYRLLTLHRAEPMLYVASEDYDALGLYGKYDDFKIVIPGPNFANCSLTLQSLT